MHRLNHHQPAPPVSGKMFFGCFLLTLSKIKRSQVMFMRKFGPTALNFGQDICVSYFILGQPEKKRFALFSQSSLCYSFLRCSYCSCWRSASYSPLVPSTFPSLTIGASLASSHRFEFELIKIGKAMTVQLLQVKITLIFFKRPCALCRGWQSTFQSFFSRSLAHSWRVRARASFRYFCFWFQQTRLLSCVIFIKVKRLLCNYA